VNYNNLKYIFYEGKFYKINEEEEDHYHLDKIFTVIRKNEIIKIAPYIGISKFSEKKELKKVIKLEKDLIKFEKFLEEKCN
jgi:hypothetical protein